MLEWKTKSFMGRQDGFKVKNWFLICLDQQAQLWPIWLTQLHPQLACNVVFVKDSHILVPQLAIFILSADGPKS